MDCERLKEYLDSLTDNGIPSVDCIVKKEHEEVFRYMTGFVDKDGKQKVGNDTRYLVFSMTKIQTMTAILQLVEKGLLSLEDEVGDYLSVYRNLKVNEDGKIVKSLPLKIKHLVSMQSGLDYDLQRGGITRVLKEKGMQASTREIVDSFVESPLAFQPGTHFKYSLSHDVAAAIVEEVSGMSFGDYLKTNIWEVLGMKRTFFAKPLNDKVDNLAEQYIYDDCSGKINLMQKTCNYQLSDNYQSGGAGLISCTTDYSLLADAISCNGVNKEGKRILLPESVDTIKTNLLGEDSLKDIAETMGRKGYGYGVGMQILLNPKEAGALTKRTVFGWDGAAGSCTIMDSETKTSLVFMMHIRGYGPAYSTIHPTLRDLVFD